MKQYLELSVTLMVKNNLVNIVKMSSFVRMATSFCRTHILCIYVEARTRRGGENKNVYAVSIPPSPPPFMYANLHTICMAAGLRDYTCACSVLKLQVM